MLPILFHIRLSWIFSGLPDVPVYGYGMMLFLAFVSTQWLATHLTRADVRLLDCTFLLPADPGAAQAAYAAAHIGEAQYFDIEAMCDPATDLPHMLPTSAAFAQAVGRLGIGNAHQVVLYDNGALAHAVPVAGPARVWWMFRVFGHDRVSVLDGGLAKWQHEGRPVSAIRAPVAAHPFRIRYRPALVRSQAQMRQNLTSAQARVVDARSSGRFNGTDPEPRPGLRRGNIPNSVNEPITELLDPVDKTYLSIAKLRSVFAAAGVGVADSVVTSCGSGVTACVLALALHVTGHTDVAVYDGSWAEWGREG